MSEWIISSSVLIVMVIALRYVLRGKINLRLQYALWLVVLVRLLMPVSLVSSSFSVAGLLQNGSAYELSDIYLWYGDEGADVGGDVLPDNQPNENQPGNVETPITPKPDVTPEKDSLTKEEPKYPSIGGVSIAPNTEKLENSGKEHLSLSNIFTAVWIGGMAVAGAVLLASNLHFWLKLRKTRWFFVNHESDLPIYESSVIETPCLFGLIHPTVYVTPEAIKDPKMMHHVLTHETTHYAHRDHIWAALRCLCLVLHWYNPLVWWAAALSRRDAELACDEGAIERIGEAVRAEYGRTLIGLTCQGRSHLLSTATTMTGSVKGIKERIMLIANRPKMARYTVMILIVLVVGLIGCTYCGAKETNTGLDRVEESTEGEVSVSEGAGEETEEPTTEEAFTEDTTEEITEEPTTQEPTTEAPETEEPTTEEPTTEEPTTEAPEPVGIHTEEVQIAGGEIVQTFKAGKTVLADLDGDGEAEKITVQVDPEADYWHQISMQIDDIYCDGKAFCEITEYMEGARGYEFYLIDLDTSDRWTEIAFYETGPSLDPAITFLRYRDGEIIRIGEIPTGPPNEEYEGYLGMIIPGDGTVSGWTRYDVVQTQFVTMCWELKNSSEFQATLEEKVPEYYSFQLRNDPNYPLYLRQDATFYQDMNADPANVITLPKDTVVDIARYYPESGWIQVIYEEGTKAVWLLMDENEMLQPLNVNRWGLGAYIAGLGVAG